MKQPTWLLACPIGLYMLLASNGIAIGAAPTAGGASTAGPAATAPAVAVSAPAAAAVPVPAQQQLVPAGRLIGLDVRNPAGDNLGRIVDIVIDAQQNRAHYAVLGFGGFLNLGETLFAYPVEVLRLSPQRDVVMLDVPRERLEQAPGFDGAQLPEWADYLADVDRFWGTARGTGWTGWTGVAPPAGAPRGAGTTGAVAGVETPAAPGTPTVPGAAPTEHPFAPQRTVAGAPPGGVVVPLPPEARMMQAVRASDLIDRDIIDPQQVERIGQVREVVLDLGTGDVPFAVAGFDTGWFRADRLVTVPLDALRRDARFPRELVMTLTREQLAQAPSFEPAHWPQFDEAEFRGAWERFLAGRPVRR